MGRQPDGFCDGGVNHGLGGWLVLGARRWSTSGALGVAGMFVNQPIVRVERLVLGTFSGCGEHGLYVVARGFGAWPAVS